MSQPSTPRTPRTPRAGRMSQTPQRSDNLSSDIPSSPGLQYPSSPGLGISSPLPFATAPGFQVVYQPGQYAQTPIGRHMASEDASSPIGMALPSSPPPRSHLVSSNLRSDISYGTPREGRGGMPETPRRRRNDVVSSPQVARHLASRADPISELPSTPFPPSQDYDPSQVVKVVWGTAVEINEVIRIFKEFLEHFKQKYRIVKENPDVQTITESENRPFYPQLLDQMARTNTRQLNLDCQNLLAYRPAIKLHSLLIDYPAEVLPLLDFTLNEYFDEKHPEVDLGGDSLMIRPFGLGKTVNTRDLGPEDIDRLVTVKGLMLRASSVIPNVKKAFFQCLVCDQTVTSEADRGRITEPTKCPRQECGALNSMSLIHNRGEYADKQVCRMQEMPESIPDGQTPQSISLVVHDDLVDVCKPGDRLEITAVFRGVPVRVNPRQRTIKALYRTYLDVVHIKKTDKRRLAIDDDIGSQNGKKPTYQGGDEIDVQSEDMIAKIQEVSKMPDLYETLARSVAPSIFEHDDIKKGVLLQMFGGTNKTFQKAGSPRYRGDINVLLVGDPGTSKSQFLTYVHKIAPRGVYTSGKGSSAVGLTAYVTRDPDTRQLVLESGALVLSDGGICCIDEFDKMSDATRSVLHEVMEQQTVSVAKAGIITTLNARTSLLAAANPIHSQYNHRLPMVDNIDLPPTLISRFDLLYLVLDIVNEQSDRRLARHILSLYLEDAPETGGTHIIPIDMLTSYISYARNHCHPVLSEDAGSTLIQCYLDLRKLGGGKQITATTRQLESMIRLSEARAKLRLSPMVEKEDVEEASRLIREGLKESAMDPRTGLLDMDLLTTGQGSYDRGHLEDMRKELLNLLNATDKVSLRWADVLADFNAQSTVVVSEDQFSRVLSELEQQQYIKVSGKRGMRVIKKLMIGQERE
ncbi:MCM2/3/5 family-domain-containing protein [Gamsiella multidivaricata]|uniref:MCM2/3/5 family-domain-containing protein n=1 Tax=Gamsiella multidivaricata TaxID=101098 RepID=UPI00221FCA10|nr:MCM2/3/5 family-domain-containing protein [Gamsiella multidivaricata]KAI7830173.1 MCM2/3/5 family-domain-containing protein [Gamsiella multidivaricata]